MTEVQDKLPVYIIYGIEQIADIIQINAGVEVPMSFISNAVQHRSYLYHVGDIVVDIYCLREALCIINIEWPHEHRDFDFYAIIKDKVNMHNIADDGAKSERKIGE